MTGTIRVSCNNPECFFVGNYSNHTLQEIKEHREFWGTIPVAEDECPHKDVTITEVQQQ